MCTHRDFDAHSDALFRTGGRATPIPVHSLLPRRRRWSELSPYFTRIWTMMLRAMVRGGQWGTCGPGQRAKGNAMI